MVGFVKESLRGPQLLSVDGSVPCLFLPHEKKQMKGKQEFFQVLSSYLGKVLVSESKPIRNER